MYNDATDESQQPSSITHLHMESPIRPNSGAMVMHALCNAQTDFRKLIHPVTLLKGIIIQHKTSQAYPISQTAGDAGTCPTSVPPRAGTFQHTRN